MEDLKDFNPFNIGAVIKTLAKYLTFETLKNFRLVNKKCLKESLQKWRKHAVLVIVQGKQERKNAMLQSEFENRLNNPASDFLQLALKPFSNLKFQGWNFEEDSSSFHVWKENIRSEIKYLHLDKCKFQANQHFREEHERSAPKQYKSLERLIFPQEMENGEETLILLNMEELVMTNCRFEGLTYIHCYGGIGNHIYDKLAHLPESIQNLKLKSLKILPHRTEFAFEMKALLSRLPNLETISGLPSTSAAIQNLPIRSITFWSTKNCSSLHDDLSNNKCFLNKLEFISVTHLPPMIMKPPRPPCYSSELPVYMPPINFPLDNLESLKEFHIWGSGLTNNFWFLKSAHILRILKINLGCYEKRNERPIQQYLMRQYIPAPGNMVKCSLREWKFTGLQRKNLVHFEIDYKFGQIDIRMLQNWMPNLKVLKTVLNKETFHEVLKAWGKSLKELVLLYGSDVDDEGITSNLINFQDLRRFEFNAYCNQSKLGDDSVYHGFLKTERLTGLKICVSETMSGDAIESLQNGIQSVQIIRNIGPGPHTEYDCCDRLEYLYESVEGARPIPAPVLPEILPAKRTRVARVL